MNRGWRFCRPLPYLLATAPLKSRTAGPKGAPHIMRGSFQPSSRDPIERRLANRGSRKSFTTARAAEWALGPHGAERAERGEGPRLKLERETGFEPATSTLARSHSTTELFPPERSKYHTVGVPFKRSRADLRSAKASRSSEIRVSANVARLKPRAPARSIAVSHTLTFRSTCAASSGDVGLM